MQTISACKELSFHIALQAIALANKEVEKVLKEGSGVDKTKQGKPLSNRCLPYFFIYVVALNTTIPFEKLFHGSYSLRMFFPTSHLL